MSNQNRFLLPHTTTATSSASSTSRADNHQNSSSSSAAQNSSSNSDPFDQENNQLSVDTDFDSYWEEEARNPHRNRIRIGRQYQATVPPLLKTGEKDQRKLDELESLSFCPKKSARVSDTELDHYFTVAKSLNLFASLVETRSLLGRDVTIADLNHIRHKEGLSLASVIQPVRQTSYSSNPLQNVSPQQHSANNPTSILGQQSPQKSPLASCDRPSSSTSSSPREQTNIDNYTLNQPLMKALSHFISLHHPCHHDQNCKKLLKDIPLEDDPGALVSITAGNLRQGTSSSSSSKESKPGRSRSSLKQAASASLVKEETEREQDDHQSGSASGDNVQSPSYDDWTREEVELFSKAIEICGKNFSSIKKEFLPSKSVKSIVEYYYIGSRDVSESKKKSNQTVETSDGCSSPEKSMANNNGQGGGDGSSAGGKSGAGSNVAGSSTSATSSTSRTTSSTYDSNNPGKTLSDSNEETKHTSNQADNPPNNKAVLGLKNPKSNIQDSSTGKPKSKNNDPRMSVYNFDEEFKEDSPVRFECPRPGSEVKPLKAKPIIPNSSIDSDAANSNVGSLKFFMDGQLVLKLNACQDQQEGIDKCHWVQSGDKMLTTSRQKRYTKRSDSNQNGSQSNSVVSSYQDDDSKNDDLTGDEDSKESMNSFTNLPQQKNNNHGSPLPKRLKVKSEQNQQQTQLPSPINYNNSGNSGGSNTRIKERSDNMNPSPVISQAMPWLQANSFAVAAALLGGYQFPPATGNMVENPAQSNAPPVNVASKPMDLSHSTPKSIQSPSRSRSRPKNV